MNEFKNEIQTQAPDVLANTVTASVENSLQTTLSAQAMKNYGLVEADLPEVTALASKIDASNPLTVSEFGRNVSEHTSNYSDELLAQVRNSDIDQVGAKLGEVVLTAKKLNQNALSDTRSKIPFIGQFIDRMKMTKAKFMQSFESTAKQVDTMIAEVDQTQKSLSERVRMLEDMHGAVRVEYRMYGVHIAAAKLRLQELQTEIATLRAQEQTPQTSQHIADLEGIIANLDKRTGDLIVLQQSAFQTLPMIRIMQTNNTALVEKFYTIKELTIPAWKRSFVAALSLNEQKNAVELSESIDNATNDILRRNADLLHKNSVATAKSNQRLVIDVSTLEQIDRTLISTVDDVLRIRQEGEKSRKEAEIQIAAMRTNLENRFTRKIENKRAA
ncbi:MAG TPA: toxic anion resistance protein [Methylobacter sp.]|jgi:uncharacterized protein YaaN involved in tellurite resistance